MRHTSLPSPGTVQGHQLRMEASRAISQVETIARMTPGGKVAQARSLDTFFAACRTALTSLIDAVAPTVSTRVRTAANTAVITFDAALSPSTSVPLTSVVFSPARTVTALVVSGSTLTVTATGVIVGDTITYTPPTNGKTDLGIKDQAGNLAATFTGVLA